MKPKHEGPFEITEVLGPVTYKLKLPASWQFHNIFHATLLKQYKENEIYSEIFTEPPPELIKGEEVYEVETILSHRKRGRGYQYYVKWKKKKKVILYPMHYGNRNIHFPTMATH